jgi:hypothetical protein
MTMHEKNITAEDPHGATLKTLRQAFERNAPGFRLAAQGTRAAITANINHLAKLAGIDKGKQTRADLYDAASRALAGRLDGGAVEYVRYLCEEIRKEWERNPLPPGASTASNRSGTRLAPHSPAPSARITRAGASTG